MIMAVAALVREKPKPSDADINNAIKPNSQTPTPASLPPRNRSSMCGRPTPGGDPLDSLIPPGACGRGQRQSGPPSRRHPGRWDSMPETSGARRDGQRAPRR